MQPFTRAADEANTKIPDGYSLQFTDDVCTYARDYWLRELALQMGKRAPIIKPRSSAISSTFAGEIRLLAKALANAAINERKQIPALFSQLRFFLHISSNRSLILGRKNVLKRSSLARWRQQSSGRQATGNVHAAVSNGKYTNNDCGQRGKHPALVRAGCVHSRATGTLCA